MKVVPKSFGWKPFEKKKSEKKNRQIEVHNLARKEIEFSRFFSPVLSFGI